MKKILTKFLCFFLVLVTISNIAVVPVYAAHTHKGVMCGKQITTYEKKDGTYHTKITAFEDICSCGKVIGTIDEVKTKEKHSFSGDICTKCKYEKPHEHKGVACGKQVTWYEKKDATNHIYYTANENLCSCGKKIGLIDQTSKTQKHSFSGDTCSKCGYTRKHEHKGVACGQKVTWYEQKDATSHIYYTANENLCSCGKNLGLIDQTSKTQNHTFSGDTCTGCGYTRKHVHNGVACGKQKSWYDNITETTHTYYTANENLCSCGEMIGYIDQKSTLQNHSFSGDNCVDCGYTRAHVHKGVMCGQAIDWYEIKDSNYHIYYTANENLCSCGSMLGYIDEKSTVQKHTYDGDTCIGCGYTRAHVHKGVMCGKTVVWYEIKDSNYHTFYTANEDLCSCGEMLGYVDLTTKTFSHEFSGDTCMLCGYTKVHKHQGVLCGQKVSWCESFDDETHTIVSAYENLCSCGEYLGLIDETRKTSYHTFDKNDICTECGYVYVHFHKGVLCGEKVTWYDQKDSTTHIYYTANEELCSCGEYLGLTDQTSKVEKHDFDIDTCIDCGYTREHVHNGVLCGKKVSWCEGYDDDSHTIATAFEELCICGAVLGTIDKTTTLESHTYDKNYKCTTCGYVHTHEGLLCGEFKVWYDDITENVHTYHSAHEELCTCGLYLGLTDQQILIQYHSFDNDICKDCGYKREHVHKGTICGKKVTVSQTTDERGHTIVYANESLCSCGEYLGLVDEKTEFTAHEFLNDTCIICRYEREHVHEGVACGAHKTWYDDITETQHTYYEANEALCKCGEVAGYIDIVEKTENHNFKDSVCTICGFRKGIDHVHKGVKCADNAFTFYEYVNNEIHYKIMYEGDHLCSCGKVVERGDFTTYEEKHAIKGEACTLCNASLHVHKLERPAEKGVHYMYSDKDYHLRIRISSGGYCACGEFVSEAEDSVTYTKEKHNFKDHKCKDCGYNNKSYGQVALEQSIYGDFSEDVNIVGVIGQMIVAEIPGVGWVADARDLFASKSSKDLFFNLLAFVPIVGSLKYADEGYIVLKHSDDLTDLIKNSDEIQAAAKAVLKNGDEANLVGNLVEVNRVADNLDEGFDSYKDFKKVYGQAGDGKEWHHIVEQSQIKKSGFDSKLINNGGNMIPLDAGIHDKVSGYYKRTVPGTGMSFRDWIAYKGFSYEEQQLIGKYVLELYGVKVK